jgi:hypothetical protein
MLTYAQSSILKMLDTQSTIDASIRQHTLRSSLDRHVIDASIRQHTLRSSLDRSVIWHIPVMLHVTPA